MEEIDLRNSEQVLGHINHVLHFTDGSDALFHCPGVFSACSLKNVFDTLDNEIPKLGQCRSRDTTHGIGRTVICPFAHSLYGSLMDLAMKLKIAMKPMRSTVSSVAT
jgi:hypothetical protein